MKSPDHLLLPSLLFLACALPSTATAQRTAPGLRLTSVPIPDEIEHVVFDWRTQRITSRTTIPFVSPTSSSALTDPPCFGRDPADFGSGSIGAAYGVPDLVGDEIVDWGVKNCAASNVVTSISALYCSEAVDASLGGPGAELTFAIYQGTQGFGVLGTEVRRFAVSGLPASKNPPVGTCYVLTIDVTSDPLCLSDGRIGWGFTNVDDLSGPVLYSVDPHLGTRDALDVYSPGPAPSGTFVGTFNYGTTYPWLAGYASYYLALNEAPPTDGSVVFENGSGVNRPRLSSLSEPLLGSAWIAEIDVETGPPVFVSAVALSAVPMAPIPTRFGELMIDLQQPTKMIDFGFGLHALEIPKNVTLLGANLYAQGVIFRESGRIQLLNRLDLTIGL